MNRYILAAALTGLALSFVFGTPTLMAAAAAYDGGIRPDASANNSASYYATLRPSPMNPTADKLDVLVAPDGGLVNQKGSASGSEYVEVKNTAADPAKTHEQGWGVTKSQCLRVLCTTTGATLTATIGSRYKESVIDANGSPVLVIPNLQADGGSFSSYSVTLGDMIQPGGSIDNTIPYPVGGDAGLTTTTYTCFAQSATTSPAGPYYQLCPLR